MKTFEWTPSESAPAAYPMELVRADLLLADDSVFYVPDDRTVYNGWGEIGATHHVGERLKTLPTKLSLTWFSYTEDKFYGGEFDLPYDRIHELFEQGLESPRRGDKSEYDRVIFGVGPEGEGSVWVSGANTMIEVATFEAPKVEKEWTVVLDNPDVTREAYIAMILAETLKPEQLTKHTEDGFTARGLWARRRQQFDWSFNVEGATDVTLLKLESLNGEKYFFEYPEPLMPREKMGIPEAITVEWVGEGDEKRSAEINFDHTEALAAFEKLAKQSDGDLVLQIRISGDSDALTVMLQTSEFEYEFENAEIQIYSM